MSQWQDDPGREATRCMASMLRHLRAAAHLPDDHPDRVAALAEKRRVLDLVERARGRAHA